MLVAYCVAFLVCPNPLPRGTYRSHPYQCIITYYFTLRGLIAQKKKAVEALPADQDRDMLEGWHDQTDFENVHFQYTI